MAAGGLLQSCAGAVPGDQFALAINLREGMLVSPWLWLEIIEVLVERRSVVKEC